MEKLASLTFAGLQTEASEGSRPAGSWACRYGHGAASEVSVQAIDIAIQGLKIVRRKRRINEGGLNAAAGSST
jgi:hypothetical protein